MYNILRLEARQRYNSALCELAICAGRRKRHYWAILNELYKKFWSLKILNRLSILSSIINHFNKINKMWKNGNCFLSASICFRSRRISQEKTFSQLLSQSKLRHKLNPLFSIFHPSLDLFKLSRREKREKKEKNENDQKFLTV